MSDRAEERIEKWLDGELKKLPELSAPESLLVRVMGTIQERSHRPWWRRSWQGWPPGLQVVAFLLLLVTAGGVSYLGAVAIDEIRVFGAETVLGSWFEPLEVGLDLMGTVWRAALLVFQAGGHQLLVVTVLFVLGIYVACLGLGTVCTRVLLPRT